MSLSAFISYLRLEKNYSQHTIKAYERDLKSFSGFCKDQYDEQDIATVSYPLIRNWIV
ncbi:MAG: site-specific integrase, partial [Muricauda sp.]